MATSLILTDVNIKRYFASNMIRLLISLDGGKFTIFWVHLFSELTEVFSFTAYSFTECNRL